MTRVAIISSIGALALVASSPAGARGGHKSITPCLPGQGHIRVADSKAQVYVASNFLGQPQFYGCAYGTDARVDLGTVPVCGHAGSEGECFGVGKPVLVGTVVAYEQSTVSRSRAQWRIIVQELRTGQVIRRLPTGTASSTEANVVGNGPVTALVLKSNGAIAWIVLSRGATQLHPAEYEVHAVDKNGSRVLASGPAIASESLALVGSTLYWTQEGKPFSTTLN